MSKWTPPPCPNAARHTPMPEGYMAWHSVAEDRDKAGQRQEKCLGCGLFAIWKGGRSLAGWPKRRHVA